MQGAINRRTGARVQIIRRLSVSVVEATSGDDARDQTADRRIDRVFELNMGIFRFKFTMNFLRFFADRAAKKWPLRGSLKLR